LVNTLNISKPRKILAVGIFIIFFAFIVFEFAYILSLTIGLMASISLGAALGLNSLNLFSTVLAPASFVLFITLLLLAKASNNTTLKAILFNASFVFLGTGIFETYLQNKNTTNTNIAIMEAVKVTTPPGFYEMDDVLGYIPKKGMIVPTTSYYKDKLLYNVIYTIDANGHRITPSYTKTEDAKSILFFGCSMTFGYGLNDHETFPYLVGMHFKDQYKIYNFAFGGYGTHQMYAALEHNLVDKFVEITPKHAIYTVIPDHINRIVNKKKWGSHDPKYILEDGKPKFAGHFDDAQNNVTKIIEKFRTSVIFERMFEKQEEKHNLELFLSLVEESKNKLKAKYPDCSFTVIFWNDFSQPELCNTILEGLKARNINTHTIVNVFPNYEADYAQYQINPPYEPHPNYKANKGIANYIVTNIIK
jgi:hypothetical protein